MVLAPLVQEEKLVQSLKVKRGTDRIDLSELHPDPMHLTLLCTL